MNYKIKLKNLKGLVDILINRRSFFLKDQSYQTLTVFFSGYLLGLDAMGIESIDKKLGEYVKSKYFTENYSTSWYDKLYFSCNSNDDKASKTFFEIVRSFIESEEDH